MSFSIIKEISIYSNEKQIYENNAFNIFLLKKKLSDEFFLKEISLIYFSVIIIQGKVY